MTLSRPASACHHVELFPSDSAEALWAVAGEEASQTKHSSAAPVAEEMGQNCSGACRPQVEPATRIRPTAMLPASTTAGGRGGAVRALACREKVRALPAYRIPGMRRRAEKPRTLE